MSYISVDFIGWFKERIFLLQIIIQCLKSKLLILDNTTSFSIRYVVIHVDVSSVSCKFSVLKRPI